MITMKKRLFTLMALLAVSISAMCQVTFTAIEGSDWTDAEGSAKASIEISTPNGAREPTKRWISAI